jgi:hypothetical protein
MCRVIMPQEEQGIKCMREAELRGAYFEDALQIFRNALQRRMQLACAYI